MDFRNCIECGTLFRFIGKSRCPNCIAVEEKEFAVVYNYVSSHKGVSIEQVSEATGIATRKIIRFLRDDRLSSFEIEGEGWESCSRCGRPIFTNTLCDRCTLELAKEICGNSTQQAYIDNIIHAQGPRMFTAQMKKTV